MDLDQWLLFLPAAILVAVSPGANNFLALVHGMRCGLGPAVLALVGRCIAFAILILLVGGGLGAVLAASEAAFVAIKWVGVGYLVWLGLRLWCSATPPVEEDHPVEAVPGRALATREFWVALTNPKAILLFTAFLPQFVEPTASFAAQLLALGAAYIAIEVGAASLYAFTGSRIKALRLGNTGQRRVNRVSGGLMLAAAASLATARRSG
jgi:threonine/homoserine/homoserine lactone efflux protein